MSASISIALIIPPTDYSTRLNYRQYENTPLEGITSIGLSLIAKGHHVRVFDCRRRSSTLEWLDSEVPSDTALLGCTTFFDSFQFVCDLANWAKIRRPGATVVAGGPLATGAYCLLLEHSKLDAVVLGEGESEVCAIADHMAKGESSLKGMAGVAVRSPGEIVVTPSPSCEVDLNALPDLDWAFLGIAPGPKAFSFMYSMGRGCTGRCRYCGISALRLRFRSPQKALRELSYLRETHGMHAVLLNDSDFMHENPFLEDYCAIARGLRLRWGCFARPTSVRAQALDLMVQSGCVNIRLGIESLDQRVLEESSRDMKVDEIVQSIKRATASGIAKVTCYFLLGLPGESLGSLEETLDFVEANARVIPRPFLLIPLPGTALYHEALVRGLIRDEVAYLTDLSRCRLGDVDQLFVNMGSVPDAAVREVYDSLLMKGRERALGLAVEVSV